MMKRVRAGKVLKSTVPKKGKQTKTSHSISSGSDTEREKSVAKKKKRKKSAKKAALASKSEDLTSYDVSSPGSAGGLELSPEYNAIGVPAKPYGISSRLGSYFGIYECLHQVFNGQQFIDYEHDGKCFEYSTIEIAVFPTTASKPTDIGLFSIGKHGALLNTTSPGEGDVVK